MEFINHEKISREVKANEIKDSVTGDMDVAVVIETGAATVGDFVERTHAELFVLERSYTELLKKIQEPHADLESLKYLYASILEKESEQHHDKHFDALEFANTIRSKEDFIEEMTLELEAIKKEKEMIRSQEN